MKFSNNNYKKYLRGFARENRQEMTKAEACLWKFVLSRKQLGFSFKRQRPIANYIADFVCLEKDLIIEVDGYSHQIPENQERDFQRQKTLEDLGYRVIRFKDSEILKQISMVRQVIYDVLNDGEV